MFEDPWIRNREIREFGTCSKRSMTHGSGSIDLAHGSMDPFGSMDPWIHGSSKDPGLGSMDPDPWIQDA